MGQPEHVYYNPLNDPDAGDYEECENQRVIEFRRMNPEDTIEDVLARMGILRESGLGRGVPISLDGKQFFGRIEWKKVVRIARGDKATEDTSRNGVGMVVDFVQRLTKRNRG